MSTNLSLGERLKKRRSEVDFSLRELARRTELTAAFLSQIERGIFNPSLNSVRRIANAQNVPMLYFLTDKDDRSLAVWANNRLQIDLDESNITYELFSPDMSGKFEAFQGLASRWSD